MHIPEEGRDLMCSPYKQLVLVGSPVHYLWTLQDNNGRNMKTPIKVDKMILTFGTSVNDGYYWTLIQLSILTVPQKTQLMEKRNNHESGIFSLKVKLANISYLHVLYMWRSLTKLPTLNPPTFLQNGDFGPNCQIYFPPIFLDIQYYNLTPLLTAIPLIHLLATMESKPHTMMWNSEEYIESTMNSLKVLLVPILTLIEVRTMILNLTAVSWQY